MIVDLPPTGVVLRPAFGQQGEIKARSYSECHHHQYEVNDRARTVSCTSCGCLLDPFQVLLDYARKERKFRHWSGETMKQEDRLHDLRDEERKIKARTAAASRKDASAAVADERRKSEKRRDETARAAIEIARLSARIVRLSGVGK